MLPEPASGYQNTWTTPDPASDWLIHDYLVADYEATPGGQQVDKVILIESSLDPSRTVQGNPWMLDLVAASKKLYSYVGNINPTADESTFNSWLAALRGNNLLVGIRVPNSIWDAGNNQLTAQDNRQHRQAGGQDRHHRAGGPRRRGDRHDCRHLPGCAVALRPRSWSITTVAAATTSYPTPAGRRGLPLLSLPSATCT